MTTATERVTVKGKEYMVEAQYTPESCEADGKALAAANLRELKVARDMMIRLPKGREAKLARQFKNGVIVFLGA